MDELENIEAPRRAISLIGFDREQESFASAFTKGRLHHAWLLAGPTSSGKATFAYHAAKYLLHQTGVRADSISNDAEAFLGEVMPSSTQFSVPPDSPAAAQITAGSHPNLLVLSRRYDEDTKRMTTGIPVGDVRRLIGFFGSTAGAGGWRVVIVDKVDDMAAPAANALLKSLEEPPSNCLFFLISDNPDRLLPTIRSRCRRLDIPKPDDAHMKAVLQQVQNQFGEGDYQAIASIADGRIARAMELLSDENSALRVDMQAYIVAVPQTDPALFHPFADKITGRGKEALYMEFLERVSLYTHETAKAYSVQNPHIENPWLDVWNMLNSRQSETDTFNLDKKQLILDVFALLNRAKREAAN